MSKLKSLGTLIKVAKQELDGLRRDLARLETEKTKMQQAIERMQQELLKEMELATSQPEMGAFFGDYAKRIRSRQDDMRENIKKLDVVMEALREKIRDQFSVQKRYELARDALKKQLKEKREKLENLELDEIAATRHERKGKPN